SDLPKSAARIILAALSKNPERRYADAREMGDRLADALRPATPPPDGPAYHKAGDQLEVAHVLYLDMAGYSALPMEDQREQLQRLQDLVSRTNHFVEAEKQRELIALAAGDGMALVFFGDPTAAAECALEIATALRQHPELRL